MELNVSEEITCNRQNHSFLSNKYTSQALYQTLQTTKWTYWKAARQYNLKFAKTLLQSGFNLLQVRSPAVPKFVFAGCVICIPPFHFWAVFLCFILTFVAVFHCFNLINFLNTLSFFKQTAGRNNLISLLWQVIFILQNFFETTLISIASNAVTYRTITTEKACFKLKGIYWRPVIELLSEMSRFSVSSDWNKHKLLLEA